VKKLTTKLLTIFLLLHLSLALISQDKLSNPLSGDEIENHKAQVIQLVKYLEGTMNFLGDPLSVVKEKEIVINESYLKVFRDYKVQIEDDLDDDREVALHKDVQAYLKDIGFFFTRVNFQFIIIDINHFINDNNIHYFKVTFNRDMKGLTIDGDSINSRKVRYMEINLDVAENDLKIASIYTTKLNEKEEACNWWNGLSRSWRNIFGEKILVYDTVEFSRIAYIGDSLVLLSGAVHEADSVRGNRFELELPEDRNFQTAAISYDTLLINTREVYNRLTGIRKLQILDISGNENILNLEPLSELTELKEVNCSNTIIRSVFPLRNLNKLQILDISNTPVIDISSLMYSRSITELNCSYTLIDGISELKSLTNLIKLELAGLRVNDFGFLDNLTQLKELNLSENELNRLTSLHQLINLETLNISETRINNLEEIKQIEKLKYLNCEETMVRSLEPLAGFNQLEILKINQTEVESLKPLNNLPALKRIYWDSIDILQMDPEKRKNEAIGFMKANPGILVIFESEDLLRGWDELEEPWKKIARESIGLTENPGKEELHSLLQIENVNLENSGVTTLQPIQGLYNLKTLSIKGLSVDDYTPLSQALELEDLDISGTAITGLSMLAGLYHLKKLNISHTQIQSLDPLNELSNLEIILADSSGINEGQAFAFSEKNQGCIIIFQTAKLMLWWEQLPEPWKTYFASNYRLNSPPLTEQLHKILFETSIEFKSQAGISSLEPLAILKGLKTLKIENMQVSDLQTIALLNGLEALYLNQVPVSDISALSNITGLRFLNVENTPLANLSPISSLENLKELNISGTQVKSLKAIGNLKQLEVLELNNTQVKNIKPLGLLPSLRKLKCFNTRISEKNIQRFKEANPQCKVVYY